MNTEIYLVRHGETTWNALGKFQGVKDIPLSENGITQAEFLKERFDGNFDVVYTSPLERAYKTAQIISSAKETQPIVYQNLKEINFGDWEGLTIKEIREIYPKEFDSWKYDKENGYLVNGEKSLKLASQRATNSVLDIAKKNKGKKIIIVAHGGIIKASLIGLFDWNMNMYHQLFLGNTSVSKISFDKDFNLRLIFLNDTYHIPKHVKMVSSV